jgi:hypothetical protein
MLEVFGMRADGMHRVGPAPALIMGRTNPDRSLVVSGYPHQILRSLPRVCLNSVR